MTDVTFLSEDNMKFCVHKKPYIVHCCDDKSILMHSVKIMVWSLVFN